MNFSRQTSGQCGSIPRDGNAALVAHTDWHKIYDVAFFLMIAGTILSCRTAPRQLQEMLQRSGHKLRHRPWLQSMSWRAFACSCSSRLPHQSPLQLVTSRYLASNPLLTVCRCFSRSLCFSPLQLQNSHAAKDWCAHWKWGCMPLCQKRSRSPRLNRVMRRCSYRRRISPACQNFEAVPGVTHRDCSRERAEPLQQMVQQAVKQASECSMGLAEFD